MKKLPEKIQKMLDELPDYDYGPGALTIVNHLLEVIEKQREVLAWVDGLSDQDILEVESSSYVFSASQKIKARIHKALRETAEVIGE